MTRDKLSVLGKAAILCAWAWLAAPAGVLLAQGAPAQAGAGADWMGLAYVGAGLAVGMACLGGERETGADGPDAGLSGAGGRNRHLRAHHRHHDFE